MQRRAHDPVDHIRIETAAVRQYAITSKVERRHTHHESCSLFDNNAIIR